MVVAEEYNDHLHEEVHLLHNQLHPLLPPDDENDNEDEMGSGVIMAEGDDDIEINGPEDVPPGEAEEPLQADEWLSTIEQRFGLLRLTEGMKASHVGH